jgi:hypothetical protein
MSYQYSAVGHQLSALGKVSSVPKRCHPDEGGISSSLSLLSDWVRERRFIVS